MELIYKKATLLDIETLVKTRIEVLRAANRLDEKTDICIRIPNIEERG